MLDINKIRSTTPGSNHHIHFNNAGASLPDQSVIDAITKYMNEEALIGGYELMVKHADALENIYHSIAKMIGANRNEIALFQSATAAWAAAFNAISFQPGDEVLCSEAEYGSNYLNFLRKQKTEGIVIKIVPSDADGCLDLERMEEMMNPKVKLIAITHVPSNGGLINPAEKVGVIAKKYNCLYLLDACQSVGQIPLEVKNIDCDFLAVTGRKYLRAPRGTGFLYARASTFDKLDPTVLDLSSANWLSTTEYQLAPDAKRFELFETNKSLQLGLGAAVDYYLSQDPVACFARIQTLATRLRDGLSQIPGFTCTDIGREKCGIVTFQKEDLDSVQLKTTLFDKGLYTSAVFPSAALIDAQKRSLTSLVRASVHYYNTEEEVDRMLNVLEGL